LLESRLAGLREQLNELTELRGKNKGVVEYMMGKVRAEKDEFESGLQRYYAVRSVFSTLTNNLFGHLGTGRPEAADARKPAKRDARGYFLEDACPMPCPPTSGARVSRLPNRQTRLTKFWR
jgi:hypothetical protein